MTIDMILDYVEGQDAMVFKVHLYFEALELFRADKDRHKAIIKILKKRLGKKVTKMFLEFNPEVKIGVLQIEDKED